MPEQAEIPHLNRENAYREYFQDEKSCIISLDDLFLAVEQSPDISAKIDEILSKSDPVTVLIEGSAFQRNIDSIHKLLEKRVDQNDQIILVDISAKAVGEHSQYIKEKFPDRKYTVIQGDMNQLEDVVPDASIDLVINDCAINFNISDEGNRKTLGEIKRLLKPNLSASLLSIVVDKEYDDERYGSDQEFVPKEKVSVAGFFYPLPDQSIQRLCWSVPYYKRLLQDDGLKFQEFDTEEGKSHFPDTMKISYRRFLLTKQE